MGREWHYKQMNSEAKVRLLVQELRNTLGGDKADKLAQEDITKFSLEYSLKLIELLQPLGIETMICTGWINNGKGLKRTCYNYLKVILENGKKLYINTLNGVGTIDKNILHGLKRYIK